MSSFKSRPNCLSSIFCAITESTITFLPASADTAKIAKGDLMAIRSKFSVMLSDYGVKNGIVGKKVAEEIQRNNSFITVQILERFLKRIGE